MTEADDNTKKYGPLTEDLLCETLKKDKGEAAQLVSWRCEDFTNKGDNYACFVTSVKVVYKEEGQEKPQEVSYVAKIAHQIENSMNEIMNNVFQKEGVCFTEILPEVNAILRELHLNSIRTAKGYCGSYSLGKEVLMLENLRQRHFKLYDRRRGIDVPHANLVLKELGRLHAASLLLEKKLGCRLTERWPILNEKLLTEENDMTELFKKLIESQMEASAMIIEKVPNYEHVVTWIRKNKVNVLHIFREAFGQCDKFSALNHGDCWNNNIMFRYDEAGNPVEVMLVDFQVIRRASVAGDLSYFLYSSFNGDVRKNNLESFLVTYYNSFSSVLREAQLPPPFSQKELLQEFKSKMTFGCVSGIFLAPVILSEEEDTINFFEVTDENMEQSHSSLQDTVLKMSKREDGHLKDRYLSIFDEMVEAGIVSDVGADAQ